MKKILFATIMVSLIVVTVFHVNAVSIKKQSTEDEEKTGGYTIEVYTIDGKWYGTPDEGCPFVWVNLRSVCGTINRTEKSSISAHAYFSGVPEGLEYTVSGWKRGWKSYREKWVSKTRVNLFMTETDSYAKNVYNPFLDNFPLLKQKLQHRICL